MLEWIIVAIIGLALFGPKALQSLARNAGRAAGQANAMKEQVMGDLSLDEVAKLKENIPTVPRNPRQAMEMLLSSDEKEAKKKTTTQGKSETAREA